MPRAETGHQSNPNDLHRIKKYKPSDTDISLFLSLFISKFRNAKILQLKPQCSLSTAFVTTELELSVQNALSGLSQKQKESN